MKIQHVIISIFFSFYPMTLFPWASFLNSMVVINFFILHCYLLEASTISIKLTMMVMLILCLNQICFQQGFYQSEIWVWKGRSTSCCKTWMTFLTTWGYDNPWCGFSTILGYESIACKGWFSNSPIILKATFNTPWKVDDGGKVLPTLFGKYRLVF